MMHANDDRTRDPQRRWLWLVALTLCLTTVGCAELDEALGLDDEVELTGQLAFVHLAPASGRTPQTSMQAVQQIITWDAEGGDSLSSEERFAPEEDVLNVMRRTARSRRNIRPEGFLRPPQDFFIKGLDKSRQRHLKDGDLFRPDELPNVAALSDEHTIPQVDRVPVRNQGSRGTCAAFAGVAQIEYSAVAQYQLSSLDLSEQRFYYMSKPECHSSGCSTADAGSWYGVGMEASRDSSGRDIPTEASCPYNAQPGDNDLQVPQSASCSEGALKVDDLLTVQTPAQIVEQLHAGHAVTWASPLSGNWETTDGLITLADSGYSGQTSHAGGHAYLIVGYRKLPNMPNEGGMCFIIKNSWGMGWGVNGYACMTLAWMQKWSFDGYVLDQYVAASTDLREDLRSGGGGGGDGGGGFYDDTVYDDDTVNHDDLDEDTDDIPEPEPPPIELVWRDAYLYGPDDTFYRAEVADEGSDRFHVRGVLSSGVVTGELAFERSGDELWFDGDRVGRVRDDEVDLCMGEFDLMCSLRIDTGDNRLYVEFINPQLRRVQEDEHDDGSWYASGLGAILPGGYDLEMFFAEDLANQALGGRFFLRLTADDGPREAQRLSFRTNGDIHLMDQVIGNFSPFDDRLGLCTGDYSSRCSMFASENGLQIMPGW